MKTRIPINFVELDDLGIHLVIKAKIGKKYINLIIDTGASKTVFDETLLSNYCKLIDDDNVIESKGINSEILKTQKATINNITFGRIKFNDFETILIDLSNINEIYSEFSDLTIFGLLGGDFLIKHNAVINYYNKTITISE